MRCFEYVKKVRETQNDYSNGGDILIAFNNHFAGFGPQSVNEFFEIDEYVSNRLEEQIRKI